MEGLAETILSAGLQSPPPCRVLTEDGDRVFTPSTLDRFAEDPSRYEDWRVQIAYGHRRTEAVRLIMDIYEDGGVLGGEQVTKARLESAGLVPGKMPVEIRAMTDEAMLEYLRSRTLSGRT